MDAAATSSAVAKQLASCNRTARDRAVRLLRSFLSATVSYEDLLKIWKGLFYCVWHSDKLPVQSDLINRLSSLLVSLEPCVSVRYFEAFVVTIRREWSGIDHLRMDKFYLLVRRFVHHVFLMLSRNGWDGELSTQFIGILSEKSLLSTDKYQAQGVNYQIAEVFLDEFMTFLPVAPEVFVKFLGPFISVLEISPDKVLAKKIKQNIFVRLVENGRNYLEYLRQGEGDGVDPEANVNKIGKLALNSHLSIRFFDSASSRNTIQGNRRLLFGLHESFLKLERELENSGMKVSFSPEENNSEVFVSQTAQEDPSKKRKKKKKESASDTRKSKRTKSETKEPATVEISSSLLTENHTLKKEDNGDVISFDEKLMSNLQKQFEIIAAESGLSSTDSLAISTPIATTKKKKKSKSADARSSKLNGSAEGTLSLSNGRSVKKVRFSLKNNLVWKPHNPLPPQSLRLPPSATPRGSALKKGVLPGPIREITPPSIKKSTTKVSSVKRVMKGPKSISPSVKRLRNMQSLSV